MQLSRSFQRPAMPKKSNGLLTLNQRIKRSSLERSKSDRPYVNINNAVSEDHQPVSTSTLLSKEKNAVEGPSTDARVIYRRLVSLALPYWLAADGGGKARWKLAGVVGLTLAGTGMSVLFNFMGRDFFNALSEKDVANFTLSLFKYLGAFAVGIPIFVLKSYYQSRLSLDWRQWMTNRLMSNYFEDRAFYGLNNSEGVDNPDQRISSDIVMFTDTALSLSLTLLNAIIDIVSFSGILYSIYPPLFAALITYSVLGTGISIALGKSLVKLNFLQEAREADLRYGLVRVRENAESIAFYRGEQGERQLLMERLRAAVENQVNLIFATRNLDFFTSFYRFLPQLLPAAVVSPLYFSGKIEFGVINQSMSAFNHILGDLSLIVYQFETLASFSAVIDRLGQFNEAVESVRERAQILGDADSSIASPKAVDSSSKPLDVAPESSIQDAVSKALDAAGSTVNGSSGKVAGDMGYISLVHAARAAGLHVGSNVPLLDVQGLRVETPNGLVLLDGLSLQLFPGTSLLINGPSGCGKTSLLRSVAGLWRKGNGSITLGADEREIMFLPQKPYMVLGSLRDQVLYPACSPAAHLSSESSGSSSSAASTASEKVGKEELGGRSVTDEQIVEVLKQVRLGALLSRHMTDSANPASALNAITDWAASLSLGEQQRLAWARLLLAQPALALLDEATSALDTETEADLYSSLAKSGTTFVSVGHRSTLVKFHSQVLRFKMSASMSNGSALTTGTAVGDNSSWSNEESAGPLTWELVGSSSQ